ncbi:phage tail protein [Streptomyces sp. TE5632]
MAGEDDVDYGRATIRIDLDGSDADAESRATGLRIQRALLRATRRIGEQMRRQIQRGLSAAAVTVRVEPDLRRFDAQLLDGLRSLDSLNIPVAPDVTGFEERLRALLAGIEIPIRVVPDLDGFDARIRAHRAPDVTARVEPDVNRFRQALAGLSRIAATVGKGLVGLLKFGAVGIAAAGAASAVGSFTAAIAPAGGIVAALPAALLGAAAAMNVLKLGLQGVSDVLGAALEGDMEKFSEGLEELAPAAQKAIRPLGQQLRNLQQSLQQSLFKKFADDIQPAVKNLSPLGKQLDGIAGAFGKAASAGLKWAATPFAKTNLTAILTGTQKALGGLSGAMAPVLQGLTDVAAAVSLAFGEKAGSAIERTGKRFGAYLSGLAESGEAVKKVSAAVAVFKQLKEIAGNVKGALSGIFQAGEESGAGLLDRLTAVTQKIEEFTNSKDGQAAIGNIFATVGTIAAQLMPILQALVTQVGAIAPALQPIFTALGPAITNLVNSLGPAVAAIAPSLATLGSALAEGLAALGPALGPLGASIGQVITALAPLLPIIGQLAGTVGSLLAPAFTTIAAVLQPVIAQLAAALLPILPPLTQAFTGLLQALIPLGVAIGQALGQAIQGLAPLLAQLAQVIVQVVVAITPLVAQIIAALLPALPPLIAAFNAIVAAIIPLLQPILGLVQALVPLASTIVSLAGPILQVAAAFLGWSVINLVVPLISGIVAGLSGLINALTGVVTFITGFVDAAIAGFKYLYNVLVGNSIIPDLVNGIISWIRQLPGRALAALSSLVSSIVTPIRNAASSALTAARTFVSDVVTQVRALPGKARAALSGAKDALVSAGRDLIQGMINGVREMAGNIASAAREVVSNAVSSAKSALGISSPSKVFAQIGRDTGRGFIEGLTGTVAQIKATAEKVAKSITKAFEGKKTKLDDRLVAMIDRGNRRLQTLAKQREALAKRIDEAIEFANRTYDSTIGAFSLQNLTQGEEGFNAKTIAVGLEDALKRVKKFNADISKLAKLGLRKDLLRDIIGMGPEKGAEMARMLASSSRESLKRINRLQRDLSNATNTFSETSADVLYDLGKDAGKGFLAGLAGQKKEIEKLMLQIAKAMQKSIRQALQIRSPSHVMRRIGEMTGAGLHVGLVRRMAALAAAAQSAARDMVRGVSSELSDMPELGAALDGANVVPLTRSQRMRRDVVDGAVPAALARGRNGGGDVIHNHHWEIREVGDARVTAQRVLNRFVLAAGVGG